MLLTAAEPDLHYCVSKEEMLFWSSEYISTQNYNLRRLSLLYSVLFSTGVWTRASHLLNRCSATASSPFFFHYFSDRVLCFCLGLALDHDPTCASYIAGIRHASPHQAWLRWSLTNFCPNWPQTAFFLIATSQVAGIPGGSIWLVRC
jgi:hypothetical protein